jgi:hypothetical protein
MEESMLSTLTPLRAATVLALCATLSALLSSFVPGWEWPIRIFISNEPTPPLPGLFFGVVLCLVVAFAEGSRPLKLLVALLGTVVAWLCAWTSAIELYRHLGSLFSGSTVLGETAGHDAYIMPAAGFVAGMIGSSLTVSTVALVSPRLRAPADWIRTIVIGAIGGLLLVCQSVFDTVLPLFLVWQPAVAASIAYGLASSAPTGSSPVHGPLASQP